MCVYFVRISKYIYAGGCVCGCVSVRACVCILYIYIYIHIYEGKRGTLKIRNISFERDKAIYHSSVTWHGKCIRGQECVGTSCGFLHAHRSPKLRKGGKKRN